MSWNQIANVPNGEFRDLWVLDRLQTHLPDVLSPTLLDVGAGPSPYGDIARNLGYLYRSQDFSSYTPGDSVPGLHNDAWEYPEHTYVCDITEIPDEAISDVVLCTEVLEHVPDPVRAFERMAKLLKPGGKQIITVPFMSLMHQDSLLVSVPGCRPFWFEYWGKTREAHY